MSKISLLPDLPLPFLGTDLIPVTRSGVTYKAPASALKTFVNTDPSVVPSAVPFKGALVRRTSSLTSVTWPLLIPWQEAVYDTDDFWAGAAPSRLTVPAGVTKVRLTASVSFEGLATAGSVFAQFFRNGASLSPGSGPTARQSNTGFSDNVLPLVSPVVNVTAGDYFEVRATVSMSGQDQILEDYRTWFALEVVEASS